MNFFRSSKTTLIKKQKQKLDKNRELVFHKIVTAQGFGEVCFSLYQKRDISHFSLTNKTETLLLEIVVSLHKVEKDP